mmetsp:Transcript_18745/g.38135  ORF Transcript_18745/g.38135 Transcript_18745/m.38135 type:complete len:92 (-) Transcript_18745:337-612(-)
MSFQASKALMELRVHLCQSSAGSKGIREFWAANYAKIKEANMKLPILLRESSNTPAKLTATYEFGVEKSVDVDGMSPAEFGSALEQALKAQ